MSETIPFAGPLKERAKEGFDRLLLAPVFLIYEIVAVLFPGILFVILLLAKDNHSIVSAFQSNLLGYKTKIFVVLVFSYLVGKLFIIPADVLGKLSVSKWVKEMQNPASNHTSQATKHFLVGVFLLPQFFGTEHPLEYFVLGVMSASFYLSTGAVLLVSSLIPGDHIFRLIEAASGILFCLRGYKGFQACIELGIAMFGIALSGTIHKLI